MTADFFHMSLISTFFLFSFSYTLPVLLEEIMLCFWVILYPAFFLERHLLVMLTLITPIILGSFHTAFSPSFAVFSLSDTPWIEVHTFCKCPAQGLETQQSSPKCQL